MYNAKEIKARTNQLFENRGEKAYKVLPALGLSKSTLENPSMPKIDTIAVIADYLDISIDYILGREVDGFSTDEQALIELYRQCSVADRLSIMSAARVFAVAEKEAKIKEA